MKLKVREVFLKDVMCLKDEIMIWGVDVTLVIILILDYLELDGKK